MFVTNLTCEYTVNPIGIDARRPRLGWTLQANERAQKQTSYQVLTASGPEQLAMDKADLWDSGKVNSDRCVNVEYAGPALASSQRCWWKVRVWDRDNLPGPWSEPASFEMGLLKPEDWQGQWISGSKEVTSPLLRKEFRLAAPVKSARLHICGLGYYELSVNGKRVSDHVMAPAPTWYDNILPDKLGSRCLYETHDVTAMLKNGANALGVTLGNGWWSSDDGNPSTRRPFADRPVLMLQLNIELADGRRVSISSDTTWKTAGGPVTANDINAGEHYDARLEQPGWNATAFDDAAWAPARAAKAPSGKLVAQSVEPIRIVQKLRPVRMLDTGRGSVIFDMGQYISGWTELRVRGPRGTAVSLRHAGRVNYEASALDTRNNMYVHHASQTDVYTLKGHGLEIWHPQFTLHGFRYVEVIGYPGELTLDSIEGHAVNSDIEACGRFECSNDMINRVHHNVIMTFRGSFQGIPQDAADRAERLAWLGDPGFVAEDYIFNFNTARFWTKWLDDIRDVQKPDGSVPCVAPPCWHHVSYANWPCWECTYTIFVWQLYRYYDDPCVLADHYDGIRAQLERFRGLAKDLILPEMLGDHMEPDGPAGISSFAPTRTPTELTGTAYFHFCAATLSRIAAILGRTADAAEYAALAESIKTAYNAKFLNLETNQYATGSQTSNALSLYLDLVPPDRREAVLANLVKDITDRGGRLSTGIIGTDALEQALPACGRSDVMFTLATQTAYPSWGYGVVNGQTTIAEDFECSTKHSVAMKMFGSTEKFFYKDVAGLAPAAPGWATIVVRPQAVGDLKWARASVRTVRGLASVEWRRETGLFGLTLTIPVNSGAQVFLPKLGLTGVILREGGREVFAGGKLTSPASGISMAVETNDNVELTVGSGSYEFEMTGKERS